MNNELQIIDNEQFGNLVQLPGILKQNQDLATRAVEKTIATIDPIESLDLSTVDAHSMETNDVTLAGIQARLKESYVLMESRRKPFTGFFDEVKSLFTAEENKIKEVGVRVKTVRDNWQREKARRAAEEQAKRDEEIKRKQEEIQERARKTAQYNNAILKEIGRLVGLMNDKFNQHTADTIESYANTLRAYSPLLNAHEYDKILGEASPLSAELYRTLSDEYTKKLSLERDRLIDLIPSRKAELIRIADDAQAAKEAQERLAQEKADREAQIQKESDERGEAAELLADAESMNAVFDVASQATPVLGLSKGTVVKKKYQPTSHQQHIQIIQWWVKNCMGQMTLEDLKTKLSFMRTAADKALNSGEIIEGVEVVDDYSTRGTAKRTA